jgi:hypothetical protein
MVVSTKMAVFVIPFPAVSLTDLPDITKPTILSLKGFLKLQFSVAALSFIMSPPHSKWNSFPLDRLCVPLPTKGKHAWSFTAIPPIRLHGNTLTYNKYTMNNIYRW